MDVGERIRKVRIASGYSQDELAKETGISRNTISRWERGVNTPSLDELKKVSDFLKIDLNSDVDNKADDNLKGDLSVELEKLSMNLEDIRLDLISVKKARNRMRTTIAIVIAVAVFLFLIVIGSLIVLINWPSKSDNQPIRIEYLNKEDVE